MPRKEYVAVIRKRGTKMPIIDFHNHYYPPAYLDALRSSPTNVKVGVDAEGNPLLHYPGDYNIVVRGHRDIDYREQVLTELGVDTQVVSLTTPGTHVETPERAADLAQLVNDAFADVVATRGPRFAALATLAFNLTYLLVFTLTGEGGSWLDGLARVALPSVVLNCIVMAPTYGAIWLASGDLRRAAFA